MNRKEENIRTAALLGGGALEKLYEARVAVFGVGGVGGYICEALARAGIGTLDIFDGDIVSLSNINRQVVALHSTVGLPKVEVMKNRIMDINPECNVNTYKLFYLPENADSVSLGCYDYIADAVDSVPAKVELAVRAARESVPLISAMGAGNKLDPTLFRVSDIFDTQVCPLAKTMRKELKNHGITSLKVVYSTEAPIKNELGCIGSVPFVPSVAGLIIAGEIIKDLIK